MVIKSLVDLYERLLARGLVAPEGWDTAKISFLVVLNPDGTVKELQDVREKVKRGKKEFLLFHPMVLPKAVVRTSGKNANFLWDNSAYVFGRDREKPESAELCFRTMRKKHHRVLDGCEGLVAHALLSFFDTFSSTDIETNPVLAPWLEVLDGPYNFTFAVNTGGVNGNAQVLVSDDSEVRKAWSHYLEDLSTNMESAVYATCSVTGKKHQKIAVVHPKIKGVYGADSSGACLVCYNVRSVCSYGYDGEQAVSSFISEYAASAYAKALNWLLNEPHHHSVFGDVTVVYWSERNEARYGDCFESIMNVSLASTQDRGGNNKSGSSYETVDMKDTTAKGETLHHLMGAIKDGKEFFFDEEQINPDEPFYILGLGSSGARISVRFFFKNSFGKLLANIYNHQEQMLLDRSSSVSDIPLWLLLKNTVRAGANVASPLVDSLFKSILHNRPYPAALYHNVLRRVYLDMDGMKGKEKTYKLNYVKAGFIKAYLLRNCHERWEELNSVSVNVDCNKKPYLLGRLFATLEGIQSRALPNINATIKDKYFNSACQTPAIIFPVLLKLSQAHMKKLNKPLAMYFSKIVGDLVDRITISTDGVGFPIRMNPEEQGVFMLGYYQEKQAVYNRWKAKKDECNESSEAANE